MSAKVSVFLGQDQQGQHFVGQGQYIRQIHQKPCRSKSILVNIGIRTSSKSKYFVGQDQLWRLELKSVGQNQ